MGGRERKYGWCEICERRLTQTSSKCTGCGILYRKIKHMNPNKEESELIRLTKEERRVIKKTSNGV